LARTTSLGTAPSPRLTTTGSWSATRKLMAQESIEIGALTTRRGQIDATGRTAVLVPVDGRAAGVIALADAARETPPKRSPRCTTWV
jgi:cation transport ATPase